MPELTVKEVRLPELHLPEIKRDEIVRALSGVHLPAVDLARARRATIKVPAIAVTTADVGRVLAAGAAVARFVRPTPNGLRAPWRAFGRKSRSPVALIVRSRPSRSLLPFALGAIVIAALGAWMMLRRPAARRRLDQASRGARKRIDAWRAGMADAGRDVPAPVEDTGVDATAGGDGTDDVANATDGVVAFEESPAPG